MSGGYSTRGRGVYRVFVGVLTVSVEKKSGAMQGQMQNFDLTRNDVNKTEVYLRTTTSLYTHSMWQDKARSLAKQVRVNVIPYMLPLHKVVGQGFPE